MTCLNNYLYKIFSIFMKNKLNYGFCSSFVFTQYYIEWKIKKKMMKDKVNINIM